MSDGKDVFLRKLDAVLEQAKASGADAVTVQLLINAKLAQELADREAEVEKLRETLEAIYDKIRHDCSEDSVGEAEMLARQVLYPELYSTHKGTDKKATP